MGTATLETIPSVFHVFRNVKASEVNNQQRSSNSYLSETTRIIQEEPGLSFSSPSSNSFTIISRLFNAVDVPSLPEWKSTAGISARKSVDGIRDKDFRSNDHYVIENGWIRYRSDDPSPTDVHDVPQSENLVLDSKPEEGRVDTPPPPGGSLAANSVVLNGIDVGQFLFKNTSQVSRLFESGEPKPLVLVQNVYDRPNAHGISPWFHSRCTQFIHSHLDFQQPSHPFGSARLSSTD